MSTTLRRMWIKILRAAGVRRFVATSGLGYRFVCHLGDFLGENPFYNRDAFRVELELCAAWLLEEDSPVVFDVGANCGFWSTHLYQMLASRLPEIYAFEPVPMTFVKLVDSIQALGMAARVHAIAAAVLDESRLVRLSYSSWNSLFAQITDGQINLRVGDQVVYSAGMTLDEFSSVLGKMPTFIKIDVEGSEIDVLRGARRLIGRADRPCILFEYNPCTLSEVGLNGLVFNELLSEYKFHYVDDFEGQKLPIGECITSIDEIKWACNLIAIPSTEHCAARWTCALAKAQARLEHDLPDSAET